MYRFDVRSGPLTEEARAADLASAEACVCPKCRGVLRDMRGQGFNALAIEMEGVCFWWAQDAYTCVARPTR